MNITRKTWVSAGIVSVVLAGGISVAAAAATGRISKNGDPVPALEGNRPASEGASATPAPDPAASQGTVPPAEDYVVSREVNPDPEKVTRYWTEQRLEDAQPLPMPVVEGPVNVTE
ncbi:MULTISPECIES: hypothetical protein [Streptosporangium]|uniref:Uncharacterized protein n=1 Tax=Streptosporangium brasiliense TaxID=47480 RepID=A0ABT9RLJ2_9ACTN|nr:hypothetical protein [Streptosporangium brasiliense]MDP9869963.1 hypothetical protein [Streptosporangium brasiliense]